MLGSHRRVGLRKPCAACTDAGCCATTAQATNSRPTYYQPTALTCYQLTTNRALLSYYQLTFNLTTNLLPTTTNYQLTSLQLLALGGQSLDGGAESPVEAWVLGPHSNPAPKPSKPGCARATLSP